MIQVYNFSTVIIGLLDGNFQNHCSAFRCHTIPAVQIYTKLIKQMIEMSFLHHYCWLNEWLHITICFSVIALDILCQFWCNYYGLVIWWVSISTSFPTTFFAVQFRLHQMGDSVSKHILESYHSLCSHHTYRWNSFKSKYTVCASWQMYLG